MSTSVILIVIIVFAVLVLRFAKKILFRFFGVLIIGGVILGYMYKESLGPFEDNVADIGLLEQKYCEEDGDADICECILDPVRKDLASKFSSAELDSLQAEKLKTLYVLQKSLRATKEAALACLAAKGASEKYTLFLQEFVPIQKKYLNEAGDKVKNMGDKIKEELSNFKDNKENIDNKY